jgi:hypothetical protein
MSRDILVLGGERGVVGERERVKGASEWVSSQFHPEINIGRWEVQYHEYISQGPPDGRLRGGTVSDTRPNYETTRTTVLARLETWNTCKAVLFLSIADLYTSTEMKGIYDGDEIRLQSLMSGILHCGMCGCGLEIHRIAAPALFVGAEDCQSRQ